MRFKHEAHGESLRAEDKNTPVLQPRSNVNHPLHYNIGSVEVINAIEDWNLNFHLGNAVKYIARAQHKGNEHLVPKAIPATEEAMSMKPVLISIKPKHALNILGRIKTVELRKRGFPECKNIIMYATSPVKALVGALEVDEVITASKETIWLMYGREAHISKEQFDAYYQKHHWAVAIKIARAIKLKPMFDPKKVIPNFHAPQSWRYLPYEVVGIIKFGQEVDETCQKS
jgi:predicted transcriptional regulator